MSSDKNRMSKEEILFKGIEKDTRLNESTLMLANIENNPDRLREMLFGLQIGDKREILAELKHFVNGDESIKDEQRKKYQKAIEENEKVYNEIEEVILNKLGLDRVEYDVIGYKGVRDNTEDFRESHVEIMLRANLKSITNTQKILQEGIANVEVTEENAKDILKLMNKTVDDTVEWMKFVKSQKEKGKFDLFEDEYYELMDETLRECKQTLTIEEEKRARIEADFPDIAREVEEEEAREREQEEEHEEDERENSDDGEER